MKRLLPLLFAFLAALWANAQTNITKVDKIQPTDETFIDMAVSAAKTSVADGGKPLGAVVILNGAWRSTGMPSNEISAEQTAINKARTKSLGLASIYTVVQPSAEACKAILDSGVGTVYFAVPAADAIAKGVYTDADYNNCPQLPKLIQIPYKDANDLVNSWKN